MSYQHVLDHHTHTIASGLPNTLGMAKAASDRGLALLASREHAPKCREPAIIFIFIT